MSTYSVGHSDPGRGMGWKVLAAFLGFLTPFVMVVGLWLAISAHNASNDAHHAAASAKAADTAAPAVPSVGSVPSPSFAGTAPANADAIAMRHAAFPAALPAAPAGAVARIHLPIADRVVSVAPGIRYQAWTFGDT